MLEVKEKNDKSSAFEADRTALDTALESIGNPVFRNPDDINISGITVTRKKTLGELLFNRTVYTGIGFFLNEIISVIFATQFEYGKGKYIGKEGFQKASAWMARVFKFKEKIDKEGKVISATANAGNTLLWVSLTSGGFSLLLPMKWLEDHKPAWVEGLNHFFDKFRSTKLTHEERDARDDEVEKALACEYKQTWKSILTGRFIAIGGSIGLGKTLGKKGSDAIKDAFENKLTSAAEQAGLKNLVKKAMFKPATRIIGVETVSCAFASVILEIASKFYAKKWRVLRNPELCAKMDEEANTQNEVVPPASTDDKSGNAPKNIIAAKPKNTYVEKVRAEPQQQLQAGV